MKKLLFLTPILFLFFGCATTQNLEVSKRTRIYNNPYNEVFKAAMLYCNEKGFPITNADKDLGFITTDFKESDPTAAFFLGNKRTNINFNISEVKPDQTRVIANVSYQAQGSFGSWSQQNVVESVAEDAYNTIFRQIDHLLKGEPLED